MSANWPMRYASLSTDGKLVAIAGRRGFTHYSVASGKWKLFTDPRQEQDFTVRGGMLWFHHVLVVAADVEKTHQVCHLAWRRHSSMRCHGMRVIRLTTYGSAGIPRGFGGPLARAVLIDRSGCIRETRI